MAKAANHEAEGRKPRHNPFLWRHFLRLWRVRVVRTQCRLSSMDPFGDCLAAAVKRACGHVIHGLFFVIPCFSVH